ncbi:DUF3418 domain-containing protein, partial [Escherichia coli]
MICVPALPLRPAVYGLPIVAARKVNYSQIDPALCREL